MSTKFFPLSARGEWAKSIGALDTRLKRDVAIKILPAAFAVDAERLARFEREAELLAALNHPPAPDRACAGRQCPPCHRR